MGIGTVTPYDFSCLDSYISKDDGLPHLLSQVFSAHSKESAILILKSLSKRQLFLFSSRKTITLYRNPTCITIISKKWKGYCKHHVSDRLWIRYQHKSKSNKSTPPMNWLHVLKIVGQVTLTFFSFLFDPSITILLLG